ncbi:MAG: secretin N-terminal domain-containing protein [Gemmatimonadaceae bacterium]
MIVRRTLLALLVCATPLAAQDTTRIRIDFQDAELRAVVTAIAEAGAINVTYGDIPAKRVTLHLPQALARADMLPLLRSFGATHGLRVTSDGNLVRVESADAPALGERAAAKADPQLYVYRLKHARAPRLAATLQTLFGGRYPESSYASSSSMNDRQLSDALRATRIAPLNLDTLGRGANAAALGASNVIVAPAADVQIVPDETTNSLLIRAQPSDYASIRQAIDALDLRPLQVFIEVLIAEVRRTTSLDLGVSASATRTNGDNITSGRISSATPDDFLVRITRGGRVSIDVALSALAQRGDVRILSRPLILAENNLEAKILVGSQRPFVQVFRSLPTEGAVRDQVVQYRDVGTSLRLKPTINSDGYVDLQVIQEVSSATNEVAFGAPVISTREASTHLFVQDGQTVVIGGLADRQVERTRSGIPGLSSLPFIGGLFGMTHDTDLQSELYLFLTPHIVATDADAEVLKKGIEGRLDAVGGKPGDNPPVTRVPPRSP